MSSLTFELIEEQSLPPSPCRRDAVTACAEETGADVPTTTASATSSAPPRRSRRRPVHGKKIHPPRRRAKGEKKMEVGCRAGSTGEKVGSRRAVIGAGRSRARFVSGGPGGAPARPCAGGHVTRANPFVAAGPFWLGCPGPP